jgi:hypothetical protein
MWVKTRYERKLLPMHRRVSYLQRAIRVVKHDFVHTERDGAYHIYVRA